LGAPDVASPFRAMEASDGSSLSEGTGSIGQKPDATDILFFGRLERRKGPDLLARAALRPLADRPDLRVRFIGGDTSTGPGQSSMRAHLQRLVKDHAQNFAFVDRVERTALG